MLSNVARAVLLGVVVLLNACTPANPLSTTWSGETYKEETVTRGVVNGLWQHDYSQNLQRLQGAFARTSSGRASDLGMRYQVRVGINRSVFIAEVSEVAVLPDGWTYSLDTIIDDGRTINVGDVVDLRGELGTNLNHVVVLVRKCNTPPLPGERKDWDIGCKTVKGFDARGYGGEKYFVTAF
jgi:hypothetical protein